MMGTRHHPGVSNQPYFVTVATRNRQPIFRDRLAAEMMLSELGRLRDEMGFALLAYVVMPDHVHLLVAPGAAAGLSRIMQAVKGRFARLWNQRLSQVGDLWQPRYYDSAVRTQAQLTRWIEYIHRNPVQAGLASRPEEYPYCSSGGRLATDLEAYLSGSWPGRAEAQPSGGWDRLEKFGGDSLAETRRNYDAYVKTIGPRREK
jgi:putative transposase